MEMVNLRVDLGVDYKGLGWMYFTIGVLVVIRW